MTGSKSVGRWCRASSLLPYRPTEISTDMEANFSELISGSIKNDCSKDGLIGDFEK